MATGGETEATTLEDGCRGALALLLCLCFVCCFEVRALSALLLVGRNIHAAVFQHFLCRSLFSWCVVFGDELHTNVSCRCSHELCSVPWRKYPHPMVMKVTAILRMWSCVSSGVSELTRTQQRLVGCFAFPYKFLGSGDFAGVSRLLSSTAASLIKKLAPGQYTHY